MIFPSSSNHFTLLTELNLTVPKARPEVHTFDFIGSGPGPVRDFGTERALAEPLGPNTGNFPNSSTRFTLLTELNLSLKARPEAHTFDFIGSDQEPVRDFGTEQALVESLGPNTTNFQNSCPRFTLLTELNFN